MNTTLPMFDQYPNQWVWVALTSVALFIALPRWRSSIADRLAVIAILPSTIGSGLFVVCFAVGQGAKPFLGIWTLSFFFLVFGMLIAAALALTSLFLRPRDILRSYMGRFAALVTAVGGMPALAQLFPDA